uniref:Uncharacterized protein n=1 Tax=Moumouvirus sp. 'Monve' TaxID=1128131 RepID=H2EDA3_9VIRU|nr:hypothetical protein mv_L171 [Moumouvirus Monve]
MSKNIGQLKNGNFIATCHKT